MFEFVRKLNAFACLPCYRNYFILNNKKNRDLFPIDYSCFFPTVKCVACALWIINETCRARIGNIKF